MRRQRLKTGIPNGQLRASSLCNSEDLTPCVCNTEHHLEAAWRQLWTPWHPLKLQRHGSARQAQWVMQPPGSWEGAAVSMSSSILLHSSGGILHPCRDAGTNCCQVFGKMVSNQPYTASSSSLFPMFLAWQHLIANAPLPVMDTGCSLRASEQPRSAQIPISARIWSRMRALLLSRNGHRATPCPSPFSGQHREARSPAEAKENAPNSSQEAVSSLPRDFTPSAVALIP